MGKKHDKILGREQRTFADARAIDVNDRAAMRFWAERLGVSCEDLAEVVREVGPNTTAVALKFEAPQGDRVAPPAHPNLNSGN